MTDPTPTPSRRERARSEIGQRFPSLWSKARETFAALLFEIVYMISLAIVFPITIRGLGPEEYGEYTILYIIAGFAITWVYSGGTAAAVQLILQRHRQTPAVLGVGRRQVAMLAAPAGVLGLVVASLFIGPEVLLAAALIFGSDLFIGGWTEMNIGAIFAHRGMGAATRIRVVAPIVRASGVVALGLAGQVTILNLVIVNLVASASLLALSSLSVRRLVVEVADLDREREPTSRVELIRLSALYSTSMTTNAVQAEGEKFVLAAFRPASEVGEYQAAYRIVSVALIPLRALQAAATRWFLPEDGRAGGHVRKSLLMSVPSLAYGVVVAIAVVIGQPIIKWVLGAEFESAATITIWLSVMPLLHALAEVPPLGLLGLGANRARTALSLVAASIAVIAYFALIPGLGWKGAVIGTYISEIVTIIGGWWLLLRRQRAVDLGRVVDPAQVEGLPDEPESVE